MKEFTKDISVRLILGIIFIGSIELFCGIPYRKNLSENGAWGVGEIIGYKYIRGLYIRYKFKGNEKVSSTSLVVDEIRLLKNKKFPVLYLKDDENSETILILKKDFKLYEKKYPDSLRWVCDSLHICQ